MSKLLIIGVSGMLGKDIATAFAATDYEVFGLARHCPQTLDSAHFFNLDLVNLSELQQVLLDLQPDLIINCAALVNLNECEANFDKAYAIHVSVSEILAQSCLPATKLIYISTDSVFDGQAGDYSETAVTNPLNNYAKTKLAGELATLAAHPNSLIIRTNIFGFHEVPASSLAEWALVNLGKSNSINGYTDIYFNPVYTKQLARVIRQLATAVVFPVGILNIASTQTLSKFAFLRELVKIFNYDPTLLVEATMPDQTLGLIRPKNTTLNVDKLQTNFHITINLMDGLQEFAQDYLNR